MALDSPRAESTDRGRRPLLQGTFHGAGCCVGAVSDRESSIYEREPSISAREASIAHRAAIHLPMDNP
jgi:hypothetical protein